MQLIDEILEQYKPLVVSVTRRYFLVGAEMEDLVQEGMIGLYKAIQNYDENQEASFKTFATLCITRQIQTAIKHANSNKNKVLNELSIGGEDGEDCLNLIISLEQNPEDKMISEENVKYIKDTIEQTLSQLEKQILNCYMEGYSYDKIAHLLNTDKKSVDNALARIRKKLAYLLNQKD